MTPDPIKCLQNAAWPVIVVTGAGTVIQANEAASETLATKITEHSTRLNALWSPSNPISAEVFIARLAQRHSLVIPLEFMEKRGKTGRFSAYISTFVQNEEKLHVIQLLAERTPIDHTDEVVF